MNIYIYTLWISGKLLHNELENHHAINGYISTISVGIFHSKLLVYRRVCRHHDGHIILLIKYNSIGDWI